MSDATTDAGAARERDIAYFANRPSPELDEVILQADYTARAALSFWRFRQLGGGEAEMARITGEDGKPLKVARRPQVGSTTTLGIHYVSDHPEVRIFHLSFIALLVLFESAANAYFFALESDFGISGGLFQAAAVSLANVATSYFIIGFWGLRHLSIPWTWEWPLNRRHIIKVFAIVAIVFGVIMVLLVNLSAAHYRNLIDLKAAGLAAPTEFVTTLPRFPIPAEVCEAVLTSDIGQSIGSAATNAMCRPFALHSLDAMVLFALGMAISALAAFEGRKSDSPFPGFSDAARQFERARKDLQGALDDYYAAYPDVLDEAEMIVGEVQAGEDGKPLLDEDGYPIRRLSGAQEIQLMRLLDERVAPYRMLLTSDPDLMRDEFGVPMEAVERVTGRRGTIPDDAPLKTGRPDSEGNA